MPYGPTIAGALALRKAKLITRPTLMNMALKYLAGKTRTEVEAIGQTIFESRLFSKLNPIGLAEIQRRRDDGYKVVVLSGAFDFILKHFCDRHDIDHWQSTQIAYQDSVCSGRLDGVEFLGEAKRAYLKNHFSQMGVDWNQSCAYSDEIVDAPLFSMVGNRFLVGRRFQDVSCELSDIRQIRW